MIKDKARVTRLRRIMKVHEQKEQIIKYDIAVLDNEMRKAEQEDEELVSHWGKHEGELREVMNRAISRRMEINKRNRTIKEKQKQDLLARLNDQKRQTTMSEKQHSKAKVTLERGEERKLLQEIADQHVRLSKVRSG